MEHGVLLTTSFVGFTECPPEAPGVRPMNKLLEQSESAPGTFRNAFADQKQQLYILARCRTPPPLHPPHPTPLSGPSGLIYLPVKRKKAVYSRYSNRCLTPWDVYVFVKEEYGPN